MFRIPPPRWGLEFLRLAVQGHVRLSPRRAELTETGQALLQQRHLIDPAVAKIVCDSFGNSTTITFNDKGQPEHAFPNVESAAVLDKADREWQVAQGLRAYDRRWSPVRLIALPFLAITLIAGEAAWDSPWLSAQQIGIAFITVCFACATLAYVLGQIFRIASGGLEVRAHSATSKSWPFLLLRGSRTRPTMLPWTGR